MLIWSWHFIDEKTEAQNKPEVIQAGSGESRFEPMKSDFDTFLPDHLLPLSVSERHGRQYTVNNGNSTHVLRVPKGIGLQAWLCEPRSPCWNHERLRSVAGPLHPVWFNLKKFWGFLQHLPSLTLGRSSVFKPCLGCFSRFPTISFYSFIMQPIILNVVLIPLAPITHYHVGSKPSFAASYVGDPEHVT